MALSLTKLDRHLEKNSYVVGVYPSLTDIMVYDGCPDTIPEAMIHLARWHRHISSFTGEEKENFTGDNEIPEDFIVSSVPGGKSKVAFTVTPVGPETDLSIIEREILNIKVDGLCWIPGVSKRPLAFGVSTLLFTCVVEDEKVSVDELSELMMIEDLVQSVEIAFFQKHDN